MSVMGGVDAAFRRERGRSAAAFLQSFRAERFVDISLAQWMALTPHEVLQVHLDLPSHMIDTMRKAKQPVV